MYSRQTERAAVPGQRLLDRLSIATSDDTVLRRVRDNPSEACARPVQNLGVDGKGQEYGTIFPRSLRYLCRRRDARSTAITADYRSLPTSF